MLVQTKFGCRRHLFPLNILRGTKDKVKQRIHQTILVQPKVAQNIWFGEVGDIRRLCHLSQALATPLCRVYHP